MSKPISRNEMIEDLKARHASSGKMRRGQMVIVKPTRGVPRPAVFVCVVIGRFGPMARVIFDGRVQLLDLVRVSSRV